MKVYDVPAQAREAVVSRVLVMDLASLALNTLEKTVRLAKAGFDPDTLWASAEGAGKEGAL